MAARNRSPLGFGTILLFHLCVLVLGVFLQNAHTSGGLRVFLMVLGASLGFGVTAGFVYRSFLWDVFRGFKSAGILIGGLVLSCVLGTFIIQDLDLRRDGVFDSGLAGLRPDQLPPFDSNNQATRFMLAESHGWLSLFPNEERERLTAEKVVLSPVQKMQVALRRQAFGAKAARTFEEGVLASKRRQFNDLTTSHFAREHRRGLFSLFQWCRRLHLFDIFEAWWFYMLLGLIAVNLIVGTIARAPWDRRSFGLAITHAGILIILSGALLDRLVGKEGYINYVYGRPQNEVESKIADQKNRVYHHLGFDVRLDRFATEYYHELLVQRLDFSRRHDGSPWGEGETRGSPMVARESYPIRVGVPMKFEQGAVTVMVHAYKPRVHVETRIEDVADGPLAPAIEAAIYRQPIGGENLLRAVNQRRWLFALSARERQIDFREFRFEYLWAQSPEEYDALIKQAPRPDNGTLVLRSGLDTTRVEVTLGASKRVALGGRMIQIHFAAIRSALASADNVNLDRRLQRSEEPVLYLTVNDRQVSVPRDDKEFTSGFDLLEGVEFRFEWPDPRDEGVYNIYRIVEAAGRPRRLVQVDYEGVVRADRLRRTAPVALVGRLQGFYFNVRGSVRSARRTRHVAEVSDEQFLREGGGRQDDLLAAWADIEIDGRWGRVRRQITPYDGSIAYGDDGHGNPLYLFELFRTSMALDWFSVLTVLDPEGQPIKSHAVQVNSPLRYRGYRFFQATAATRPDGLSISGISVTYNPGVNFMYVGFYVLVMGVCHIFFLRRMIDRDRRHGNVLFGFEGRLGRATFWRRGNVTLLGTDLAAILLIVLLGGGGVFWFFVLFWWIPSLWPRLALHVKRCHDVDRSGWFLLIPVWSLIEAWGLGSYPGENRFGQPPK